MEKKKILVIDDEESIRKSFCLALENNGYDVTTAPDAESGLRFFEERKYDLIFIDLSMPGMNGTEAIDKIREKDDSIPICIVTAFYQKFADRLKEMKEEGINFRLENKPIGLKQIESIVSAFLNED